MARRNPDGGQDGAAALDMQVTLYDIIGALRLDLIGLRCQVRASQGMDIPSWCPQPRPEPAPR
ncbi:hypothetical protein [Sphingomonas koreensis]|uniref:hypothetical protein n=1 Tax=Sphingomonas koreensis TaxID=93064 RepID=UPI000F7E9D8B|nr:hypothetical protein [Sphingomonas koreensis]MDC7808785.1 hypothetical protein [Sphingomonas koreensis]RSU98925.1 hypothetical protein CA256_03075 [Sphingomonas koreensis]